MDIVTLLRNQAQEIAEEGHNGWGNTMKFAADEIETLRRHKKELAAQFEAAQQSAHPTGGGLCAICGKSANHHEDHTFVVLQFATSR